MTPTEYLRELAYPIRSGSTFIALVTCYLLVSLASAAGIFGLWLALVVYVAMFRYLTMITDARARGEEAAAPGIEFFVAADLWTFVTAILVLLMATWARMIADAYGEMPALFFSLTMAALLPAMIAVLVITRSPVQCVNPISLLTLVRGCGPGYAYAPLTAVFIVLIPHLMQSGPKWVLVFVELYLLTAFFAVTGAITRKNRLVDAVAIPEAREPDTAKRLENLERDRQVVLDHAYGLMSRGNRDGGLQHIFAWLDRDPAPDDGCSWFFRQMLCWEQTDHALFFAQPYITRLLADGEHVKAAKLILRCRLINERFRPLPDDLPVAIRAAEASGNQELADALRRS